MRFSEKLMILRRQKGISQEELADVLDVSRQSVYKWESGTNMPDIPKLEKIRNYFGVSFDYLLDDTVDIDDREKSEREPYVAEETVVADNKKPKKRMNTKGVGTALLIIFGACLTICAVILGLNTVTSVKQSITDAEKAEFVSELIDKIGEVTGDAEDRGLFRHIDEEYASLTDSQKKKVRNYSIYLSARLEYKALMEIETANDPTRTLKIDELVGRWTTRANKVLNIIELEDGSVILLDTDYTTSATSSKIRSKLKEYDPITQRMEGKLYMFSRKGNSYVDMSATKDDNGNIILYVFGDEYRKNE